jgi:hypothetical protein
LRGKKTPSSDHDLHLAGHWLRGRVDGKKTAKRNGKRRGEERSGGDGARGMEMEMEMIMIVMMMMKTHDRDNDRGITGLGGLE